MERVDSYESAEPEPQPFLPNEERSAFLVLVFAVNILILIGVFVAALFLS